MCTRYAAPGEIERRKPVSPVRREGVPRLVSPRQTQSVDLLPRSVLPTTGYLEALVLVFLLILFWERGARRQTFWTGRHEGTNNDNRRHGHNGRIDNGTSRSVIGVGGWTGTFGVGFHVNYSSDNPRILQRLMWSVLYNVASRSTLVFHYRV